MEDELQQRGEEERAKAHVPEPLNAWTGLGLFVAVFLGVLLPGLTIGVEFSTGMCGGEFFDPIPTWIHLLLACLVPAGNTVVIIGLTHRRAGGRLGYLAAAIGASLLVSLCYTVLFIPMLPLAIVGLIFAGLGLLPLTPLLSLIATLGLAIRVVRTARREQRRWLPGALAGAAGVIGLLALAEVPVLLTYRGLQRALSDDPAEELAGILDLRRYGSESALRRLATPGTDGALSFSSLLFDPSRRHPPREQVARVTYRVTGEDPTRLAHDGEPGWFWIRDRRGDGFFGDDWGLPDWDRHLGSSVVGPSRPGLSLVGSRLDGFVEAPAALAYLEWTMTFENRSTSQEEARGVLRLPPGGAVSRLTLWIEGEEREAAFAARGKVTQAYQSVVRRRRDPVLVTTAGRDSVLLRCFPVPPQGRMKVRVGITAPLELGEHGGPLELALPALGERNFAAGAPRAVWITSHVPLREAAERLRREAAPEEGWVLRGELPHAAPGEPAIAILAEGPNPPPDSWAEDYVRPGVRIRQAFTSEPLAPPALFVVVLDGSRAMAEKRGEYEALLAALDPSQRVELVLALERGPRVVTARPEFREALAEVPFVGGIDNSAALKAAWDRAAAVPGSLVFWVHGPQPVLLGSTVGLMQRFERHPGGPPIVHCQRLPGPHRLLAELEEAPLRHVSSFAGDELLEHFATIHEEREGLVRRLEELDSPEQSSPADHEAYEASGHLVRLWALGKIEQQRVGDREAAATLAGEYRLVTPVSGAVVLETREQYEASELDPAALEGAVPTVPEPGEWALLVAGAVVLWIVGRKRWREARA